MRVALVVLSLLTTFQVALTAAVPFCAQDQTALKGSSSRKPVFHTVAGDTVENSYIVSVKSQPAKVEFAEVFFRSKSGTM